MSKLQEHVLILQKERWTTLCTMLTIVLLSDYDAAVMRFSVATTPSITVAACCFQLATVTDPEGGIHKACFSGEMLTLWMINVSDVDATRHTCQISSTLLGWVM